MRQEGNGNPEIQGSLVLKTSIGWHREIQIINLAIYGKIIQCLNEITKYAMLQVYSYSNDLTWPNTKVEFIHGDHFGPLFLSQFDDQHCYINLRGFIVNWMKKWAKLGLFSPLMRIRILIDEYDYIEGRDYYDTSKKEWPYERIFSTLIYILSFTLCCR